MSSFFRSGKGRRRLPPSAHDQLTTNVFKSAKRKEESASQIHDINHTCLDLLGSTHTSAWYQRSVSRLPQCPEPCPSSWQAVKSPLKTGITTQATHRTDSNTRSETHQATKKHKLLLCLHMPLKLSQRFLVPRCQSCGRNISQMVSHAPTISPCNKIRIGSSTGDLRDVLWLGRHLKLLFSFTQLGHFSSGGQGLKKLKAGRFCRQGSRLSVLPTARLALI